MWTNIKQKLQHYSHYSTKSKGQAQRYITENKATYFIIKLDKHAYLERRRIDTKEIVKNFIYFN